MLKKYTSIESLKQWEHDLVTARDLGMDRDSDADILPKAKELERILISRDKDFGKLVFLRMLPENITEIHRELKQLIQEHTEDELK